MGDCLSKGIQSTNSMSNPNSNLNTMDTTSAMLNTNNKNISSENVVNSVIINAPANPINNISNPEVSKLKDDYEKLKTESINKERQSQILISEKEKKIQQLNDNINNKDKEIKEIKDKLKEMDLLNSKLSTANKEIGMLKTKEIQNEQNFKIKENEFIKKENIYK